MSTDQAKSIEDGFDDNGLILSGVYLPIELIQRLLYYIDEKTLLNCHLVCKQWNEIMVNYVWRKKAEMKMGYMFSTKTILKSRDFYSICANNLFGRNLLKNHSGAEGFKYWKTYTDYFFTNDHHLRFGIFEYPQPNLIRPEFLEDDDVDSSDDEVDSSDDGESDRETDNDSDMAEENIVVDLDNGNENEIEHQNDNNEVDTTDSESENDDPIIDLDNSDNEDDMHGVLNLADSLGGWIVECPPNGAPLPPSEPECESKDHCFVTTYYDCYKEQVIDLVREGFSVNILDNMQPPFEVNEWYCCRNDCPAMYNMRVQLVNESNEKIDDFVFRDILQGDRQSVWFNVKHEFRDYGPGLRKIRFVHGGRDRRFWAGHYGSKMAAAYVKAKIPNGF